MRIRRLTHSSVSRTLVTLVTSACIGGTGSGVLGVFGDTGGTSNGAAPVLSFFAPPGNGTVSQVLSIVQVAASDSLGSVDTTFTGIVRITLTSNATGAGLSGTTAVRANAGIATFTNLSIDKAGTYTLQASATGAAPITSNSFVVSNPATP